MGSGILQPNSQLNPMELKIATLNYSGILLSPYQFYECEEKQRSLSDKVKKALDQEQDIKKSLNQDEKRLLAQIQEQKGKLALIDQNKLNLDQRKRRQELEKQQKNIKYPFKMDFGPYDQCWQSQRYSPLYMPDCGIKNIIHMMSKSQFQSKWDLLRSYNQKKIRQNYNEHILKKSKKKKQSKQKKDDSNSQPKAKKDDSDVLSMEHYLYNLKTFDLIVYRTILQQLYGQQNQWRQKFDKTEQFQLDSKVYRYDREQKFKKAFLNEKLKIKKTIEAIKSLDLDIFFIQEASNAFIQAVEKFQNQYRIVKSVKFDSKQLSSGSIILIRQSEQKFGKLRSLLQQNTRLTNNINLLASGQTQPRKLSEEQIKLLNLNSDTVIQFLYNLILISPHLTSKQSDNPKQIQDLKYTLAFLRQNFPGCHIILAGDLNSTNLQSFAQKAPQDLKQLLSVEPVVCNQAEYKFNIVPNCKMHITSSKKRTSVQAQKSKRDKHGCDAKDYIISDLQIKDAKIMTINGEIIFDCEKPRQQLTEQQKKQIFLLPSTNHPYDHFLLTAKILVKKPLQHVTDASYIYYYKPQDLTSQHAKYIQQHKRDFQK